MTDQDWRTFADESDHLADARPGDLAWLGCALCILSAVFSASVIFAIIHLFNS